MRTKGYMHAEGSNPISNSAGYERGTRTRTSGEVEVWRDEGPRTGRYLVQYLLDARPSADEPTKLALTESKVVHEPRRKVDRPSIAAARHASTPQIWLLNNGTRTGLTERGRRAYVVASGVRIVTRDRQTVEGFEERPAQVLSGHNLLYNATRQYFSRSSRLLCPSVSCTWGENVFEDDVAVILEVLVAVL